MPRITWVTLECGHVAKLRGRIPRAHVTCPFCQKPEYVQIVHARQPGTVPDTSTQMELPGIDWTDTHGEPPF